MMIPLLRAQSSPLRVGGTPGFRHTGTVGRKIIEKGAEKITFFPKKNGFFSYQRSLFAN